jgi:hypothetical protein
MRPSWLVTWAYMVELIASFVVTTLLVVLAGATTVSKVMHDFAGDISTLFGAVMVAAALGFLWTFFSKADTDFYAWLEVKGAFAPFRRATEYVILLSFAATVLPLCLKLPALANSEKFGIAVAFVELLATINLFTLVRNVLDLMRLHAKFTELSRKAK